MPNFTADWSRAKDEVETSVKKDKEAAKFLAAVYEKFDQGLSKDLKETKTGSTCCDQYAAAYRAGETSKAYREIIKQTKNWPSALEEGKEQLDGVLKKIGKEAESILVELKSDVKGNATQALNKWSSLKSTTVSTKNVDVAIAKWLKATNDDYLTLVRKAASKNADLAIQLSGKLMDLCVEIQEAYKGLNIKDSSGENELLQEYLDRVFAEAEKRRDLLDGEKDRILIEQKGVAKRDEKQDAI
ncbi:MAG: hypothetical protein JNK76_06580 [Planctomycetales bacterium]|nr:hypothetical protein [Planctomycetales bacterium]MBN8623900.1 hypothetical protein [Planctomycetota bacterium]